MNRKRWLNRLVLWIFAWFFAAAMLCLLIAFVAVPGVSRKGPLEPWKGPLEDAVSAEPARQSELTQPPEDPPDDRTATNAEEDPAFAEARQRMVRRHLRGRDIDNARVLEVMGRVRRQLFVPEAIRDAAYADRPLPIGKDQTISQPYIVALMTQLVEPTKSSRALDIGTGSGYQAAVLGETCKEVYSIEIVKPLADQAKRRLADLGYTNITVRHGDGYQGWKEKAPFDVIIVAAAPDHVPQPLIDQLAPGGKLVIPVGHYSQELLLIEKKKDGTVDRRSVLPVRFVPMTGKAQER